MRRALLLGAGGHSRVVLSILADVGAHSIEGIIDINNSESNLKGSCEFIMGVPVYGLNTLNDLTGVKDLDIFLSIGDCNLRRQWWDKAFHLGFSMPNLVSPSATIHPSAALGSANIICSGVFIGPEAIIGSNDLINTGSILEHESSVGNHCHIAPRSVIAGRSSVDDNCFIGVGSVIIDGISITRFTTVGAGAVVIKNINSPDGVYVGVPCRRLSEELK